MRFSSIRRLAGFGVKVFTHQLDPKSRTTFGADGASTHQLDPKSRTTFGADVVTTPESANSEPPPFETQPAAVPQGEGDSNPKPSSRVVAEGGGSRGGGGQVEPCLDPAPFDTRAMPATQGEGSLKEQDMNPLPQRVAGGWRGFDESHVEKLHALYYNPDIRVSAIAKVFCVSTSTLLRWIDEMGWPSRRQARKESMAVLREKGAALHAAQEQPQVLPVKDAARIGDELDKMASTKRPHAERPAHSSPLSPITLRNRKCAAFAPRLQGRSCDKIGCDKTGHDTIGRDATFHPSGDDPADRPHDGARATLQVEPNAEDLTASIETQVRQEIALMQQRMHDTSAGAGERNAQTLASLVRTLRALKGIQSEAGAPPGPHDHQYDTDLPPRDLAALRQALFARVEKLRAQAEEQERAPQGPS